MREAWLTVYAGPVPGTVEYGSYWPSVNAVQWVERAARHVGVLRPLYRIHVKMKERTA